MYVDFLNRKRAETTLRAIEYHLPLPKDLPPTIQGRAWSSPIWYSPAKQVAARLSQAGNRHARLS